MLTVLACLFIWGGCSFGVTKDQIMEENGLSVRVTYHANGGSFENNVLVKDIYYPVGNPAAPIGFVDITNMKIEYAEHELEGWYHVKKDENGNPIYQDEAKKVFALGEKVDFSKRLEKGKNWEICANWVVLTKVKVKLVVFDQNEQIDRVATVQDSDGNAYQTGEEVASFAYQNGVVNTATLAPFETKDKSHTFVEYYSDEACTQNVAWPIERDKENDVYIYVKYITGNWKVLKTSFDVLNMFNDTSFKGVGYYLLNDITYTDGAINSLSARGFDYKLYGNGHTIKNLSVVQTATVNMQAVSMFGKIGEKAEIKDVTFENLKVSFTLRGNGEMQAYYLFHAIDENAKMQNVTVASGELKITKQASVNLQANFEDDWICACAESDNVVNLTVNATKL